MTIQPTKLLLTLVFLMCPPALGGEFEVGSPISGFGEVTILPVDEAFNLSVVRDGGKVEVLWQIQPGYYLYRHRLDFKGSTRFGTPVLPDGIAKTDEFFGAVEVYYEGLVAELSVTGDQEETLVVEYQGCADAGICYPPQKREFSL